MHVLAFQVHSQKPLSFELLEPPCTSCKCSSQKPLVLQLYLNCLNLILGAPPPPPHAINRGIGTEGLGCILGDS